MAGRGQCIFTVLTCVHHFIGEFTFAIKRRVSLRNSVAHFFGGGHVADFVSHLTVHNFPIWCFDETVFVHTCECRQRVDKTNVWPFRRFNRTHTTVVCWVNVTHLKARTLTCQTTWPKRRQTTFVGNFGQRVGLVHELGQLARAKEFTNSSRCRFRVDQVLWHHSVDFDAGHTFFDRALHTQKANTVLVFHQLADRTHATVAEVVNIVNVTFAVTQFDQCFNTSNDVFFAQSAKRVFSLES